MNLTCICPECKNKVDLARYPDLKEKMIIECSVCGITLEVAEIVGSDVSTEIVDEGK